VLRENYPPHLRDESLSGLRRALQTLFKARDPGIPKTWLLRTSQRDLDYLLGVVGGPPHVARQMYFRAKTLCENPFDVNYSEFASVVRSIKGITQPVFIWLILVASHIEFGKPKHQEYQSKLKEQERVLLLFQEAVGLIAQAQNSAPLPVWRKDEGGARSLAAATYPSKPKDVDASDASARLGFLLGTQFPDVVGELSAELAEVRGSLDLSLDAMSGYRRGRKNALPLITKRALRAAYDRLHSNKGGNLSERDAGSTLVRILKSVGVEYGAAKDTIETRGDSLRNLLNRVKDVPIWIG
jgi:hypothetical protein